MPVSVITYYYYHHHLPTSPPAPPTKHCVLCSSSRRPPSRLRLCPTPRDNLARRPQATLHHLFRRAFSLSHLFLQRRRALADCYELDNPRRVRGLDIPSWSIGFGLGNRGELATSCFCATLRSLAPVLALVWRNLTRVGVCYSFVCGTSVRELRRQRIAGRYICLPAPVMHR